MTNSPKLKLHEPLALLTLFLIPFYFFRFSIGPIPTNIFEIGVLATLIAYLFSGQFKSNLKDINPKILILPAIFLLFALVSIFSAENKVEAAGIFKGWFLIPVIFGFLLTAIFPKEGNSKITPPLLGSALLVSIWAILQKAGLLTTLFYQRGDSNFDQYLSQGRVFGPFDSPNFLAMFLVPVFFLSLSILFSQRFKKSKLRIALGLSLILPLLAIYLTGSRGGLIALIVGSFVLLFSNRSSSTTVKVKPKFQATLFVVLFLLLNYDYLSYANRAATTLQGGDGIRVQIYQKAIELLPGHYLWGLGLGSFQARIAALPEAIGSFQQFVLPYALHPHNLFLAIWLNLGLLGFVSFLGLLFVFFTNILKSKNKSTRFLLAAMLAILVHGFFDTTYFKNDLSVLFWLIFFMGAQSDD